MKKKENKNINTKINISKNTAPSQAEIKILLELYQKGLYTQAEKIAQSLTKEFPKHQFSWKVLGVLLKHNGKVSESLAATQKAVALSPKDADVHLNLGIILKDLGRLNDAVISYKQAIAIKPNYAEAYNNLGNTIQELGELDNAEESYRQAIALIPGFAEAYNNLGVVLEKLGRLGDAKSSYRQAISINPNYAEAHNNLGNTLQELGELNNAVESYRKAISLKPNYGNAHNNLGNILRASKKYEEAIYHFDILKNDFATALSLECLYICGNYKEFYKRLNSLSELKDMNLRVAAVSSFASHQMKKSDPYPFCTNPLDFIKINNLASYDYSNTLLDEIIKETDQYHVTWEARTTKLGYQGPSDIFQNRSKIISHLERIIHKAIDAYYNAFKSENNVFIKSWPSKHKLEGWFNRLIKHGHHTSHIHQTGWLSGVIYLKTINSSINDEGAIEFSLHGYDLPILDENYSRKIHRPKKGDIVLFPSSLFHRTIPFTSETERTTIAFDLKAV